MNSENNKHPDLPIYNSREIISKYDLDNKLPEFIRTILDYNKKVNIVSRETAPVNLVRIAADCLIPFEYSSTPTGKFFDIGSGGGLPAVVLMFAFPGLEGILIERTRKKADFLNHCLDKFGLPGQVINKDFIEAVPSLENNTLTFGTMKLVRLDHKILRDALKLIDPTGKFIYYSSPEKSETTIPENILVDRYDYYLDDINQLRSISFFSHKP